MKLAAGHHIHLLSKEKAMSDRPIEEKESSFATQAINLATLTAESAFKATLQQPYNTISVLTGYELGAIELVGALPGENNHYVQEALGRAVTDSIKSLPVIGPLFKEGVDSRSH